MDSLVCERGRDSNTPHIATCLDSHTQVVVVSKVVPVEMGSMGAIRILLLILHSQGIMCAKDKAGFLVVTGKEGQGLDISCTYPVENQNNSKYFCRAEPVCRSYLINTEGGHDRWVTKGRLSLYDNISAGLFVVRMDRLDPGDSGTYCCGVDITDHADLITVIQLNVTQTTTTQSVGNLTFHYPGLGSHPANIIVDKRNLPMFLTVVSCLAALLFVFLFTLYLVFTFRNRRHASQRTRAIEMSSDYEIMKSGVLPEPNRCSCPNCDAFLKSPQNEPRAAHLCDSFRSKQCESVCLEDYTEVDVSVRISQYQNLDMSSVEEHIYYGIGSKPANL